MSVNGPDPARKLSYEAALASRDVDQIRRRFRRFVVPLVVTFLAWYFLYVVLAAFVPDLMARAIYGRLNVGLCLGLLQFVSTFAVTAAYLRWTRRTFDPLTDRLRERLEYGGLR